MKKYIIPFTLIFLITLVANDDNHLFSVYSVHNLLIPYNLDADSINIILVALNFGFVLLFVYTMVKKTEELFNMGKYIIPREYNQTFFVVYLKEIIQLVCHLIVAKLLVDFIFSLMNSFSEVTNIILFSISTVLTAFIWLLLIFCLKIYHVKANLVYFLMLLFILIAQLLSFEYTFFSVFIIASSNFFDATLFIVVTKLILILFLFICNMYAVTKYEDIGD